MAERILDNIPDTDWPASSYIHPEKQILLTQIADLTITNAKNELQREKLNDMRVESLRRSFSGYLVINPNEVDSTSYLNENKERVWEYTIGKTNLTDRLATSTPNDSENCYAKVRWNLTRSKFEIPGNPEVVTDSEGNRFIRLGWDQISNPMDVVDYVRSVSRVDRNKTKIIQKLAA